MKVLVKLSLAITATVLLGTSGCTKNESSPTPQSGESAQTSTLNTSATEAPTPGVLANNSANGPRVDLSIDSNGLSKALVVMKTNKGTIKFRLYAKDAPNTVARFIELAQSKFYNGQTFHRVVQGFTIQTGDPKCKGKTDGSPCVGGSGQRLKPEFNGRKHVRGAVGMARITSDIDSADSQFYIMLGTFPHLDEKYTVFGQVVDFGEKIADKDVLSRIQLGDEVIDLHVE